MNREEEVAELVERKRARGGDHLLLPLTTVSWLVAAVRAARDIYDLAAGLDDDDPWFGEQRNAEERLATFRKTLGHSGDTTSTA